ncbi:MAG: hypothetical protein KJ067_18170 [Vicinamibacteria bacterium]|nr:hypothetical protein [Vicinamibacteria bacterium]
MSRALVVRAGRNLLTPHGPESYPGLRVIRPGGWPESLIAPADGQTVVALGGEHCYPYETVDGGRAEGFELAAGDRATSVHLGPPHHLAEWRIVRGARIGAGPSEREMRS